MPPDSGHTTSQRPPSSSARSRNDSRPTPAVTSGPMPAAVVRDGDGQPARVALEAYVDVARAGVLHHVGERLRHDPVGRDLHGRRQARRALGRDVHVDLRAHPVGLLPDRGLQAEVVERGRAQVVHEAAYVVEGVAAPRCGPGRRARGRVRGRCRWRCRRPAGAARPRRGPGRGRRAGRGGSGGGRPRGRARAARGWPAARWRAGGRGSPPLPGARGRPAGPGRAATASSGSPGRAAPAGRRARPGRRCRSPAPRPVGCRARRRAGRRRG